MSSSGRSLRARPVRQAPPPPPPPTARQLENREMQRRRRNTPVTEANRVYRRVRQLALNEHTYDNGEEHYTDFRSNMGGQLNRLTAASPMRKYYETLVHKLNQGKASFMAELRKRHIAVNHMSNAHLNATLRAMAKNTKWNNLKNKDPISLANASNWPGNLAFTIKRGNHVNYFTVPSFIGYFGQNWNRKAVMNKGHPLTRATVARKNINVVRFTGNKPNKK